MHSTSASELGEAPTQRAITEHIAKLKAGSGLSPKKGKAVKDISNSAASTPTKASRVTQTGRVTKPTTPSKKGKKANPTIKDESDDDDNGAVSDNAIVGAGLHDGAGTPTAARKSLPRYSKTPESRAKVNEIVQEDNDNDVDMDDDDGSVFNADD